MKFLITNIILLFLSQSLFSSDNAISFNGNLNEVHDVSYDISSGFLVPSINLTVSYSGNPPNQGIALLSWVFIDGSTNTYTISRSIEGASWEVIDDNVPGTSSLYNDTIPDGYCEVTIQYKLEAIDNASGNTVISNIAEDIFTDSQLPEAPILDSVSIVNNSQVIIGWESSASIDVIGTIIYRLEDIWKNIDTIFGNSDTSYTHNTINTCNENYLYAIAALPSCGLPSPKTELTAQRTILLEEPIYDLCSATISLSWEPYINSTPEVEKYQIWASINGGNPEIIDEIPGTSVIYEHNDVAMVTQYNYFVRAIFGNSSSTSCTKLIATGSYIDPQHIYLVNTTVETDNSIMLTIDPDLSPITCTWDIYRREAGGVNESLLASLNRTDITTTPFHYHDETADGSLGFYKYKINVNDSCGKLALESNIQKSIFLEGNQLSDIENQLVWNQFEGWDAGVEKYYIYRITADPFPGTIIDSVSSTTTEYTDNISAISMAHSTINYYIQAVESEGDFYGYKEVSNSNIIQFFRETEMYMPSAFRPLGQNSVFKPVTVGFGGSEYLFQIYNRWGQKIFETNDPAEGWNGMYNGTRSPQGTYVYRLVYNSVFNERKSQKGIVTLID